MEIGLSPVRDVIYVDYGKDEEVKPELLFGLPLVYDPEHLVLKKVGQIMPNVLMVYQLQRIEGETDDLVTARYWFKGVRVK